jgi:hypothetical protein
MLGYLETDPISFSLDVVILVVVLCNRVTECWWAKFWSTICDQSKHYYTHTLSLNGPLVLLQLCETSELAPSVFMHNENRWYTHENRLDLYQFPLGPTTMSGRTGAETDRAPERHIHIERETQRENYRRRDSERQTHLSRDQYKC